MSRNATSFLLRYGFAAISIVLAIWLRRILDPLLGLEFPFATLFFAILWSAWYGGFGPALLAVVLGGFCSIYFLLPPRGNFSLDGSDQQVGMLLYLGTSLGIALLGGTMHAATRKAALAQTNASLQEAEERIRLLIKEVQDYAIFMLDATGHVATWNAGAERNKGYQAKEIIGRHFSSFYPAEDIARQKPEQELQQALAEGRCEDVGWRLRKDGSRFWARVVITPIHDAQGQLRGFAKITRDITEGKRAEERFRQAVESAPNGMVMIDSDGLIVLVNAQTEKLFGYPREELLGQSVELLVPERFRGKHPDFRKTFFANPQVRSMGVGRDLYGQRKDGSEFPVEIGLNPIKTDEGLMVLSAITDITERKRAERVLRESQERLHIVVENMIVGVVISGLDGQLLHWNRAALELHGFTSSEEWCRRLPEFIQFFELSTLDGQVVKFEDWPMSRLLRGEQLRNYELRVRRLDTKLEGIWSYGGDVVLDATGRQVALLTMIDITKTKQAQESLQRAHEETEQQVIERTAELQAANKELEAFSYSVSHDLRAPLRAIDGFSRILIKDFATTLPQDVRTYLEDIRANTLQMGRLVDDLLAFSRLSRQPVKKQSVAPARLVKECLAELHPEQRATPVDIRIADLAACQADPALLKQVWMNLLSNALKYTSKKDAAVVEIGSRNGGPSNETTYFVRDNGVGFDMRYVHKLFGVFQRLHRAEDYAGTGVGLAIVQRIVHRHGGRVWAESQPEKGATFYFTLANGGPDHA